MARAEGILRLLLVDDSLTDADSITGTLRSAGHAVRASRQDTVADIEKSLTSQTWDLIICRDTTAAVPPRELLNLLNRLGRDIPCIVLASEQDNIEMLYEIGAQDIIKYSDTKRLQFAVERELQNLFSRRLGRRNERALRESEKRSRLLLESSRDAVAYMHEGMHIYVNSAYLSLFGYDDAEDIDGLPILDMITVDDQAKFKSIFRQFSEQTDSKPQSVSVQCIRADGNGFKANIEFSHAEVEGENCTQVVVHDESVTVSSSNDELQSLRTRDLLTGLYGRAEFKDELESVAGKAGEGKGDAELLYIVIEGFQEIKEQIGLGASDAVLKDVAMLLRKILGEGEILARYSDQVFTVIIESDDDNYVLERAKAYQQTIINYKPNAHGTIIELSCNIGISRITEKSQSISVILENADRACMEAQHKEGNNIERYHPPKLTNNGSSNDASDWQERLQDALKNDGFELFYQPIVSLHGEEQELYDILLRLKEDNRDPIAANQFIQYASQSEWMGNIDEWVITNALKSLVEHRKEHPKTRFFIRLSKQTLAKTEFIDWLCTLLNSHGLDGVSLVFEISETAAIENIENAKVMISKLKNVGCEFALEHFGSGLDFSQSLSELDVDYLKINGTFVENMTKDAENQAAVKAIIEMTKEAGKQCIAEFVSDANSLALLWRLGVDYAQGYYIHEPSDKLDYNFEDDDL